MSPKPHNIPDPTPHSDPADRVSMSLRARAKINLSLAVAEASAQTDGYHPIASWMARLDLADDLLITRLEPDRLSRYAILWHAEAPVRSPIDWSITKDLAVRAHLMLEQHAGRSLPIQLKLDKRIPVGGGLGGASADAAAMLVAVNNLFELGLAHEELAELSTRLGSDVAYCLMDTPAFVGGLGERVEATPSVEASVVLILPEFGCNTARVYAAFDANPSSIFREGEVRSMALTAQIEPEELFNDLASPAEAVAPRLGAVLEGARDVAADLPVHVTGSGSTCFVVCPEGEEQARVLAEDIQSEVEDVRAVVTTIG